MRSARAFVVVFAATVWSAPGCDSESSDAISGEEACFRLGRDCHGLAREGPLEDCHEIGHDGDPAICSAEYERCAALCAEAKQNQPDVKSPTPEAGVEAGAPDGGSPSDAAADAPSSEAGPVADAEAPPDAGPEPIPPAPTWSDGNDLCRLLSNVCHGLEETGPLEDCHTLGHDGDAEACLDQSECVEQCWDVCARKPDCADKFD